MPFTTEFPNFPISEMPKIPEGFRDSSWGGDACPFFLNDENGYGIYVDREKPEDREFEDVDRFVLVKLEKISGEWLFIGGDAPIATSNDWNQFLSMANELINY